ncbi:1-acyl-sn-glycerol-3-phosphate acyltransferase [Frankia sp. AgB1.9]|uniref:lysophospholipid acyltransferase family protein n=1 Tax=unclassified Frankia TaxID=2632575 RepID=UPI001931B840|nr:MULTISPECIES: lysophospholipid acyltransferase family protein [unclassified Frankia]MBL7494610.1 1-acyl-sn-glycerol-3-phosphate acyltransferase [Frankia sp. AgW1.1]MBL7553798.1 1-acyl-sn-glycerol-3-phosphate acyltransferase [Frankia sp. AgB1.9]MBL7617897.1 1-acyl-sn-glycerol-3-phosphate acyltransferase [Frankia sp. AgB1.8]
MPTDQPTDRMEGRAHEVRPSGTADRLPLAPTEDAGLSRDGIRYRIVYRLLRILIGPVLRFLGRPRVYGLHNIPPHGGAILASNHLSFLDSLFLALVLRRRVTFLAKSEYFTTPGFRGGLKRAFFTASGQISIDRNNERRASEGIRQAIDLLRQGELVGIYPEGTRSPDGRLYRGKTGVARVAATAPAPVIPVAMIDTVRVLPPGRRLPRRGRVEVRIGPPLDLDAYGDPPDLRQYRARTDEIMKAIGALSDQPYVDQYAQQVKAKLGLAKRR